MSYSESILYLIETGVDSHIMSHRIIKRPRENPTFEVTLIVDRYIQLLLVSETKKYTVMCSNY